jgi:Sec-independent protein translocase protein TatA
MDSPLGAPEIIILLAIVILLFGGKNLRQLGDAPAVTHQGAVPPI